MYIGDEGGTGKSRLIHAIKGWFNEIGKSKILRLAAYTGTAAANIGASTLHNILNRRS